MGLQDVLGDEVRRGRPPALEVGSVGIADAREVGEQGVEPDVADVVGVEGELDAPVEAFFRTRDAQVAEAGIEHCERLLAVALGLQKFGVLGEVAL